MAVSESDGSRKLQPLGDIKLPGKRLKFLKVLPWVSKQSNENEDNVKLVVFVTTDIDGSYVRGYVINLASGNLADASAVQIVFTYDIRDIRLTHVDAGWSSKNGATDGDGSTFNVMEPKSDESEEEESDNLSEESMDET